MPSRPETKTPRHEALVKALDEALRGTPRPLYNLLARNSNLPSPRANEPFMLEVAEVIASLGVRGDKILHDMATIDADYALGGSEFEFVPMCGVAGMGARAAKGDKAYPMLLSGLHAASEDLRFKVRDTVPLALARIGAVRGDTLVHEVESWMDGFFQAAAVLRALADASWLTQINDGEAVVARLTEAFVLADKAPRSASRYPGYKALVDELAKSPGIAAGRFGVPVFDAMIGWSKSTEPVLRDAIEKNLTGTRLAGRHANDITRVRHALGASAPVRRDPTTYVGPTRGRGKPKGHKR